MRIYLASDHAGFELKAKLKIMFEENGHDVEDFGAHQYEPDDDYPDFVSKVARAVADNPDTKGIVIGGSGQGEAMVCNRMIGARAAVYYGGNPSVLKVSREHNDANILSLGARFITEREAIDGVKEWLDTPFSNEERHIRRIAKF